MPENYMTASGDITESYMKNLYAIILVVSILLLLFFVMGMWGGDAGRKKKKIEKSRNSINEI